MLQCLHVESPTNPFYLWIELKCRAFLIFASLWRLQAPFLRLLSHAFQNSTPTSPPPLWLYKIHRHHPKIQLIIRKRSSQQANNTLALAQFAVEHIVRREGEREREVFGCMGIWGTRGVARRWWRRRNLCLLWWDMNVVFFLGYVKKFSAKKASSLFGKQ